MTTHNGEGEYTVETYVDAENAFGAMIRNDFTCTVQHTSGDSLDLFEVGVESGSHMVPWTRGKLDDGGGLGSRAGNFSVVFRCQRCSKWPGLVVEETVGIVHASIVMPPYG